MRHLRYLAKILKMGSIFLWAKWDTDSAPGWGQQVPGNSPSTAGCSGDICKCWDGGNQTTPPPWALPPTPPNLYMTSLLPHVWLSLPCVYGHVYGRSEVMSHTTASLGRGAGTCCFLWVLGTGQGRHGYCQGGRASCSSTAELGRNRLIPVLWLCLRKESSRVWLKF